MPALHPDDVVSWLIGEDEDDSQGVDSDTLATVIAACAVRHEALGALRATQATVGAYVELRDTVPEELTGLTGHIEKVDGPSTVAVRLDPYSTGYLRFHHPRSPHSPRNDQSTTVIPGVDKICCYLVVDSTESVA